MNKKALIWFLTLTFGFTIGLIVLAKSIGLTLVGKPDQFAQLVIAGAMFIPGLSAIFVQKVILKQSLKDLGFNKWGSWRLYGQAYLLTVLLYAINYFVIYLFVAKPDWTLNSFLAQYVEYGISANLPAPASTMILVFTVLTFVGAPIFNMIPSLGEEIGWRGFLLPNLLPLGKIKALVLSGMIWALWHTPMILIIGFGYGEHKIGALAHFIAVTCIGVAFGYLWLKSQSVWLAAFAHAVFNANAYGVWAVVFPQLNKMLFGPVGISGIVLYLIVATLILYKLQKPQTLAYNPVGA